MPDKTVAAGILVASLGSSGGLATWVMDINTEVATNSQMIVSERELKETQFDYLKEQIIELKEMIKDLD